MERWIERTGFNSQDIGRNLLDMPADGVAVGFAELERLQNQQVKSALQEVATVRGIHYVEILQHIV
jgi:hypothetical protein